MAIVPLRPYQSLTTIAFIDGSLADLQTILSGLDPSVTAIVLDPAQNGIQQMADALAGMNGLDVIHIISHGASGQINLGTTQLSQDTLNPISNPTHRHRPRPFRYGRPAAVWLQRRAG